MFFIIGFLIKIDSKGPIFFKQERVGENGDLFVIYKFRTMVKNAENKGSGYRVENKDPRITGVGNLLRKTSLDELPQLINVLKGDMSLVGPRPTLEFQVKDYDEYQEQRLKVKPGITGLAQVNGRASLNWDQRIEYDIYYVENRNFLMDFKIILKTFVVLFKNDDIYADENPWDRSEEN